MIIVYAEDTQGVMAEIEKALRGSRIPIQFCESVDEAKDFAENSRGPGGVVLICTPTVNQNGDGRKLARDLMDKGSQVLLLDGADVTRYPQLVVDPVCFGHERILQIREMVGKLTK